MNINCACGNELEDSEHFLLHCPQFDVMRQDLFGRLSEVPGLNIDQEDKPLCDLLLFGDSKNSVIINRIILEAKSHEKVLRFFFFFLVLLFFICEQMYMCLIKLFPHFHIYVENIVNGCRSWNSLTPCPFQLWQKICLLVVSFFLKDFM